MSLLRTSVIAARRSLFSALGLLAACGPGKSDTDTDSDSASEASSSPTTTATEPTTTATEPTTTATPPVCQGELLEVAQRHVEPATPSGFQRCDDGLFHRAEARTCLMPATPANCPADAVGDGCKTNADCVDKPFGSCQAVFNQGPDELGCACTYGCETDADCPDGQACRCAGDGVGGVTQCIPADCRTDADCGGGLCGYFSLDCGDPGALTCQTPQDTCDAASDCPGVPCTFEESRWQCQSGFCGRPFVVDAAPACAPAVARDDWRALLAAPSAPPRLRARLAAHWTRIAGFEHASVASFARFILDLLALAAPPGLVLAAQRALADEVEHARVGYALASLYAGTGVGPGPLAAAATARPDADLDALVAAAIAEACVAETLAGLELVEAAAHAEDPALRRLLGTIAADEQRHAELGWRFVQWALQGAAPDRRARARHAFAAALADAEADLARLSREPGEPELRAHGVLDAPLRAAVWRRGLDALVRPAAAALCAA